ncbi:uncharacterized protein LOC114523018 [Dendronephthya gigantea]|uniref:uncharacterized protein LOC114523018 n=1 Tax=Dendronephthya gigantea TaxID=151771 RepID=UPI00106B896E|nr:uncharacterized protein LOC114523018 [Dendronephthya gigantea]
MSNIEPKKVFVKFIPMNTTREEIRDFFNVCGTVVSVDLKSKTDAKKFSFAFIMYETQTGADRAVAELNNQVMKNKKGDMQSLFVVHAVIPDARKEKLSFTAKEYQELCRKCDENEEKIKQIYNNPVQEKEITELLTKKHELQARQVELKKTNEKLKGDLQLLDLQLKIKNLEMENTKLKEAQ